MDAIFPVFFIFIFLFLVFLKYQRVVKKRRSLFLKNYEFPSSIKRKVGQLYPHLTDSELNQVIKGLRDYFYLISSSQRKIVAMPSQVVDVAWHEFILFTREYSLFCSKALGRFLHHTPAEAMESKNKAQSGIKRAWRIACHKENINPFSPRRLPLLFVLDTRLNIEDGFHYELDCMKQSTSTSASGGAVAGGSRYCVSHIGCSSGCAGSAGDGGCSGDSGGGGCGGGD